MGYVVLERPHDFLVGCYVPGEDGQEWQTESQYVFSEDYGKPAIRQADGSLLLVEPAVMSHAEAKSRSEERCRHLNGGN